MTKRNDTPSKRSAQIYREAARRAESRNEFTMRGACLEIRDLVAPGEYSSGVSEAIAFRKMFDTPRSEGAPLIWGWTAEDQNERVLALCFMAAMVERP